MDTRRRLGPPDVVYEIGRQLQKVSMTLRRHTVSPVQEVCACGRLPHRRLPVFGPRCEVACQQWDIAAYLMGRILDATRERPTGADRAVGRAPVPPHRPGRATLRAWLTRRAWPTRRR